MAVSMDDDVPLILTLDDGGSGASAPRDSADREELPGQSKACCLISFLPGQSKACCLISFLPG